jgi:hypothetical protein
MACIACSNKPLPPEPQPPLVHRITYPGETLAAIASWYTGSSNNWKQIAQINPEINPHKLRMGKTVLIPAPLLKRSEPLPKDFLKRLAKSSDSTKISSSEPQDKKTKEEEKKTESTTATPEPAATEQPTPAATEPTPQNQEQTVTPTPGALTPTAVPATPTPDPLESSVESLLNTPAASAAAISPDDKAKQDLIEEMLKDQ